jgi:hypothetical protein
VIQAVCYYEIISELGALNLLLKCVEDTSEEACNVDGVYVMLQNQRWGKILKYCGSLT